MASQPRNRTLFPTKPHTHTIILLHGRDSTSAEFGPEFFESQDSSSLTLPELFPSIKWVFPTSKIRPSARFSTSISQWFDMWSVEDPSEKAELQIEGLKESIAQIRELIEVEAAIVGYDGVVLGGISQGCATALLTLLTGGVELGGFVGMCGWLPFEGVGIDEVFEKMGVEQMEDYKEAFQTRVFLSHCEDDEVVPIQNGEKLRDGLQSLSMKVIWESYADGGHWINEPKGIDHISAFLGAVGIKGIMD